MAPGSPEVSGLTPATAATPPSEMAPQAPRSLALSGLAVGPGVAIGVIHIHESGMVQIPEYRIPSTRVEHERLRLAEAVDKADRQLKNLRTKSETLPGAAGEELGYLLDAYRQMMRNSRLVSGVDARIASERINAESAVKREMEEIAEAFRAMDDSYLAARGKDIRDVGWRLIRVLTRSAAKGPVGLPRNSMVVADDLSPADTALLNPKQVAGLVTATGGSDSHTAIMARSLGLPAVVGVSGLMDAARGGETIVIDGTEGTVVLDPEPEVLQQYRQRRAQFLRARRRLNLLKTLPAETKDGVGLSLLANLELPSEVESALHWGAEGVGLLRSEFLFMNRDDLPGEEEQFRAYRQIVKGMDGRPVTIRTLDVGGDKLSDALAIRKSPNPALGLRAIRLSLDRPDLLDTQLAAILRAGALGPVRMLLPMIGSVEELLRVKAARDRVAARLQADGVALPDPLPPLGVMIEIPGAALLADALAAHADFFAIGTNDLIQYTLAIDRSDQSVAHLYNPVHPAVLRLIQFTVGAARRAGIPVSVCGEMAGDPALALVLMGLGVRELSMAATGVPLVKQVVRRHDGQAVTEKTAQLMLVNDTVEITRMVADLVASA
ncbi:MAG: phosphoenolpyruvate--protein phosphotransferase [Rhodospirillaceae bacterium]